MFVVRLLVFLACAAAALWTLHTKTKDCAFGKRAFALGSMLDITQVVFRLGSGADTYPRTLHDTNATTATLDYVYCKMHFLGCSSLNRSVRNKSVPLFVRRWNDDTPPGGVPPSLQNSPLPKGRNVDPLDSDTIGSPGLSRSTFRTWSNSTNSGFLSRRLTSISPEKPLIVYPWMIPLDKIKTITYWLGFLYVLAQLAYVGHMMAGGGAAEFNHRRPPTWGPEIERTYSFRAFITDLMHWVMLTDLLPHQQAAAILMRLTGSARELTRSMTGDEIMNGAMYEGVFHDPVSYIIAGLRGRFGQLDEETRLAAMTEMLAFTRHPQENINQVLSRYELVRGRARDEGNFVMSVEGAALQLLRACHCSPAQLMTLLQPLNNNLPTTEAEFRQLQDRMRRIGHVLEHAPNNVAQSLRGNQEARQGAYAALQHAASATPSMNAYFGSPGFQDTSDNWQGWNSVEPDYSWSTWTPDQYDPMDSAPAYWTGAGAADYGDDDDSFDSGTDSDTSSDDGTEFIDNSDIQNMTDAQAGPHIFMAYRHAKRKWRRYSNKQVRHVRRKFKRSHFHFNRTGKGYRDGRVKGKYGKSKGKGNPHSTRGHVFLTQTDMLTYLKGKGKGGRHGSSGQSFGRSGNPKDRNGNIMKCHNCGSTDHLIRECDKPMRPKGEGKGAPSLPTDGFHVQPVAAPQTSSQPAERPSYATEAARAAGYLVTNQPPRPGPLDELLASAGAADSAPLNTTPHYLVNADNDVWPTSPRFLPPGQWSGNQPGNQPDPMQVEDPWSGAQLPRQSPSSSSQDGNWNAYIPNAAQAPQQNRPPTTFTNDDELASSVASDGNTQARPPVIEPAAAAPRDTAPAMPNFLNQAQLQDILTRGRTARQNISRAANLPDGQATYAERESEARRMQYQSVFGRGPPATPVQTPRTDAALAKARARIPAIFTGARPYGVPTAPSQWNAAQIIPTLNLPGSATVEATSPETSAEPTFPRYPLLYGNDGVSVRETAALTQPSILIDPGSVGNILGPTRETHAPPTGSTSQQHTISFINSYNRLRGRPATVPVTITTDLITRMQTMTGIVVPSTPNFREEPAGPAAAADVPVPDATDDDGSDSDDGPPPLITSPRSVPSTVSAQNTPRATDAEMDTLIYEGEDSECSICLLEYEHGVRVCRIQCGHTYHASCWQTYMLSNRNVRRANRTQISCPNCRGGTHTIALWNWIDHARLTQYIDGSDGPQVENQYDPTQNSTAQLAPSQAESIPMHTPRSMQTDYEYRSPFSGTLRNHTPRSQSSNHSSQQGGNFVILPSTFNDYNEWITTNVGDGLGSASTTSPSTVPVGDHDQAFHTETRLRDGRPAILIDPGSVGNLGGGDWAREVATVALRHNRKPEQLRRDRPLNVSGVGNGSQECTHNCVLPIAMRRLDGTHSRGTFQIPVVNGSTLPGLLGLQSMRDRNAILDMKTLQLHLCGPGDYDLLPALPPGTESFQCELAPSGHLVLPCSEYAGVDREEAGSLDTGADLALLSNTTGQQA